MTEKERVIAAVDAATDTAWKTTVYEAVETTASRQKFLSTDDIWAALPALIAKQANLRAIGPVMRRAAKAGLIKQTGRFHQSRIGKARWRTQIWQSLSYVAPKQDSPQMGLFQ